MADYAGYSSSAQARMLARNSQYSTHSWSQSNQFSQAPPQPANLPTPVQALRPLPNPHKANPPHHHGALRVVNSSAPPTADVDFMLHRNVAESESGTATSGSQNPKNIWSDSSAGPQRRPSKKKSFVGGFVKGIRKLPRTVFGYGAGSGKAKLVYKDPSGMDDTSASVSESHTGNGLPAYTSNPSSPAVAVGPGRSRLNMQYMPNMDMKPVNATPPPAVVRLDSQIYSGSPMVRVSPPSGTYEDNANLYSDTQFHELSQHPTSDSSYPNTGDRTTIMLYNERSSHLNDYNRSAHAPPPQRTPSPGLSYMSIEPLPPLARPTSYHSSHTAIRVPLQIEPVPEVDETTPRPTYASPTPRRITSHSVLAGAPPLSSASAPQSQIETPPPPNNILGSANRTASPPQDVGSPQSVRPEPATNYRKMTLMSSPSVTSRHALSTETATSFYDPSFSSLNPVEKFFKTLYNMPWVSHDRVTVDYLPGEGASKRRKRSKKPISSWYHSMFSNSRRSSASLDLLSSGTGTETSRGSSLGAGVAQALGSHSSRSRQHRHTSEKPKQGYHRSHGHPPSSRHHSSRSHNHHSRKRNRYTATSGDTSNTNTFHEAMKHAHSPLIPSPYPFQFPPYPYPAFSAFPIPGPVPPAAAATPHTSDRHATSPHGPRRAGHHHHQPKQTMMYASPPGYAPYQPMMGAPQVFLLSPASPTIANANPPTQIPAVLVPGVGHDAQSHSAHAMMGVDQQQQQQQRQPTPAAQTGIQSIPGAF